MDDLISRHAAIAYAISGMVMTLPTRPNGENWIRTEDVRQSLLSMPSAESVKHEECEYVITKGKAGYREEYKCSACGDSFYWTQDRNIPSRFNYCRNCGRKITRFIEKEKEE